MPRSDDIRINKFWIFNPLGNAVKEKKKAEGADNFQNLNEIVSDWKFSLESK